MSVQAIPRSRDENANVPTTSRPTIVVGSDGSWHSGEAIGWAAEEARRRGACIVLMYIGEPQPRRGKADPASDLWADVQSLCVSGIPTSGVVPRGLPETELVRWSERAELVVLGFDASDRAHRLSYLLTYCLTHATCPVVVVPTSPWWKEGRR